MPFTANNSFFLVLLEWPYERVTVALTCSFVQRQILSFEDEIQNYPTYNCAIHSPDSINDLSNRQVAQWLFFSVKIISLTNINPFYFLNVQNKFGSFQFCMHTFDQKRIPRFLFGWTPLVQYKLN